jgi:DNA modification methylase
VAALNLGRNVVLIDNNASYCKVAKERVEKEAKKRPYTLEINH